MFVGELDKFARINSLWYSIHFSECDLTYQTEMHGAGEGEHFYSSKHCGSIEEAIRDILEKAERFYLQFHVKPEV